MSMQTRVFRAHHSETSVQQQQQREKGEIQQIEYAEKERERDRDGMRRYNGNLLFL